MLLSDVFSQELIVTASSGRQALEHVRGDTRFLAVVLDYQLQDMTGFDVIAVLRDIDPDVPVVMLTASEDVDLFARAEAVGVDQCLRKETEATDILAALKSRVQDRWSPAAWPDADVTSQALTDRQNDVLELLRRGMSNKQICHALQISEPTVKTHLTEIYRVLGVQNRTSAVIEATRRNLVRRAV